MEKDFVKIKYEGKIKETGHTFDKGDDLCIIVGAGHVLKGLDREIAGMKAGEKKTVEIKPEDGLGSRKPEFVKVVPLSEFKKHDTKPMPGMVLKADNREGRVLSVSGGRVKIDFNHPLAGKVLVYDVEVKEKVEKDDDKIKGLIGFYTKVGPEQLTVNISDMVEIIAPPLIHPVMKKKIADDIRKHVANKSVKFSEIFEVPKDKVEAKPEEKKAEDTPEKKE
jgi:FKBP-type peptidyl-prolyl cis-trans isomerase 2